MFPGGIAGNCRQYTIFEKKDDGTADNKKKVSNLKATADGTVTRLEVQSGSPAVRIGDGVKKGQLLVSGVLEYTDGSNAFTDSLGKVFARTAKKITLEMPVKSKISCPIRTGYTVRLILNFSE